MSKHVVFTLEAFQKLGIPLPPKIRARVNGRLMKINSLLPEIRQIDPGSITRPNVYDRATGSPDTVSAESLTFIVYALNEDINPLIDYDAEDNEFFIEYQYLKKDIETHPEDDPEDGGTF